MSLAEKTRAQALVAIRNTARSDTQRARLICLYFKVWQNGVPIGGDEVRALTDHEVAHITGIPIRSVCLRRREIMGADHKGANNDIYKEVPIVEEHEERYSKVNRSSQTNAAYCWRDGVLGESKIEDILDHEALENPLEDYTPELDRFARPEHECQKIADYTSMLPRGDMLWIGKVTEGLDEPYCLHFETDGRPPFVIALRQEGLKVFSSLGAVIEGQHLSEGQVQKIVQKVREANFEPD